MEITESEPAARAPEVFLGLSLRDEEAQTILTANYRSPLRKGDLDSLSAGATAIVIDGVLDEPVRLPTSEATRAPDRGVRLFGASSTGALLAIELASEGMIGCGQVFEYLRDMTGDREDMVRLLYVEDETRPVTIPLISIILACRSIGFDEQQIADLSNLLRSIPTDERTWPTIEATCRNADLPLPPAARTIDAKKQDAQMLLMMFAAL